MTRNGYRFFIKINLSAGKQTQYTSKGQQKIPGIIFHKANIMLHYLGEVQLRVIIHLIFVLWLFLIRLSSILHIFE